MQRLDLFFGQDWYLGMSSWQRELVRSSVELYAREERMKSAFSDYSFIVFPMAKAYEGFLKRYLYNVQVISEETYLSQRFRIGTALNPDLSPVHRDNQWVYQRIADKCGPEVARLMWETWRECRNQVFHYFAHNEKRLSLFEAGRYLEMLARAMDQATHCKLRQ